VKGHDSAESAGIVANTYVGIAYFYLGDYRRAVEFHRNVEALHEDLTRERFGLAGLPAVIARAQLAWSLAELGQFSHGIACGEEGIRIAEAVRHPYSQILADWGVGSLYLRRGELDRAIRTLAGGPGFDPRTAYHELQGLLRLPAVGRRFAGSMRLSRLAKTLPAINRLQTVGPLEWQHPPWILGGKRADLIQLPKLVLSEREFNRREIVLELIEAFRANDDRGYHRL